MRAIVSEPGIRASQLTVARGVGVLIDVTDLVMFLCLGGGLMGWSDLTATAG